MRVIKGKLVLSQREQNTIDKAGEILCEAFARLEARILEVAVDPDAEDPDSEAYHEACCRYEALDAARFGSIASDHCDGYEWPQKDDR